MNINVNKRMLSSIVCFDIVAVVIVIIGLFSTFGALSCWTRGENKRNNWTIERRFEDLDVREMLTLDFKNESRLFPANVSQQQVQ